jgi:hypothetical protein
VISSRTQTALPISENSTPSLLTVSSEGKTLAYSVYDNLTGGSQICLFNLLTNQSITRIDFQNPGGMVATSSIGFVDNNAEIVLSGPTIYDFTGKQVAAVSLSNGYQRPVAVSHDQSKIFCFQSTTQSFQGYSVSGLKQLWSITGPNNPNTPEWNSNGLQVSSDSKAVFFGGTYYNSATSSGNWIIGGVNAATGQTLSSSITGPSTQYDPSFLCAPNNQMLVRLNSGSGDDANIWNINSTTGAGSEVGTFLGGGAINVYQYSIGIPFSVVSGSTTIPAIATYLAKNGTSQLVLQNADTGSYISTVSAPSGASWSATNPSALSPNLKNYVICSGNEVGVYSVASGALLTSHTLNTSGLQSGVQWGTTYFAVTDGTNIYTFSYVGTTLTLLQTITGTNGNFVLSPSGTKLAAQVYNSTTGQYFVRLINCSTGVLIANYLPDPSSYIGIDDVSFSSASVNTIGLHELTLNSSTQVYGNEFRVYTTSGAPSLITKIQYNLPANASNFGATLSPNGLTVAMGHYGQSSSSDPRYPSTVRLYSATNGTLLEEWDNQFLPNFSGYYATNNFIGESFVFSPDSSTVLWRSDYQIVAASTSSSTVAVSLSPTSVPGGTSSTGTVTITPAPTTATTVTLSSSSTTATVPSTVTVPANSSSATFTVNTIGVAASTTASITATLSNSASSASLTITPATSLAVSFNPSTVNGGTSSTGTVTLNAAAGPSGLTVSLASGNTAVVTVPATVQVAANATTATFTAVTVQPSATTTVNVTGTAGTLTGSGSLTVNRTISIQASFNVSSTTGGTAVLLTVTLASPAPTGGTTLTLSSSNSALAPRTTMVVPAGQTSASVGVATNPVATSTAATLTVTNGSSGSASATETVLPPVLQSVAPDTTFVVGGTSLYATLQLNGDAPANFPIACSSNNAAVTLPASFTFPSGKSSAQVAITTKAVTTQTTATVTIGGISFTLTIYP